MAEEKITVNVRDAIVDCRRDQLWKRLICRSPPLSFSEFEHLTTLVQHETLDEVCTFKCYMHIPNYIDIEDYYASILSML